MGQVRDANIPIHENLEKRWSPRAFQDKPVEKEKLKRIFEAARWTMSSYNEQPWRFIVGIKNEGPTYQKVLDCLVPGNQQWAQYAPVLGITCSIKRFSRNDKPNRVHTYDAGAAAAYMTLQAVEEGLQVHQMAGIEREETRETFNVPKVSSIHAAFAMGYEGDPDILPEKLQKSEKAKRHRKPLSDTVFNEEWGKSFPF